MAGPAHATPTDKDSGSSGEATATAARVDLDVSVADAVKVPVRASLSEVSAPGDAEQKLLTAEVNGANKGRPVSLVKAEVAHSSAKADAQRSVGDVKLVGVRAYAPGLPANPLLSADLLKANATCVAGEKPVAEAVLADNVKILGEPVTVDGPGSRQVEVPGVGTVDLVLEEVSTTDSTGAATALRLTYMVNPANLGVVKASGEIVLSEATCTMPSGATSGGSDSGGSGGGATEGGTAGGSSTDGRSSGGSAGTDGAESAGSEGTGPVTQTGGDGRNLAETGGSSATTIVGGVGAALVLGGVGAMYMIRRRKGTQDV